MEISYQDINCKTIDRWVDDGWEWGKPISREVYARLRSDIDNPDFAVLIQPLQAIECQLLTGKPLPYKQLIALVDYIRKSEQFPEWHTSQTAERYKPNAFENNNCSVHWRRISFRSSAMGRACKASSAWAI